MAGRIEFHGVYLDTDSIIGIGELQTDGETWQETGRYFEVHFNGTKMRISVPVQKNEEPGGSVAKTKEFGEKMRNELFLRVLNRGYLPHELENLKS